MVLGRQKHALAEYDPLCVHSSNAVCMETFTLLEISGKEEKHKHKQIARPVVQTQILVLQGLLCGKSSEKAPYYREKGPGVQGKRWPKYRYCFSCLRVRGGSRPSKQF